MARRVVLYEDLDAPVAESSAAGAARASKQNGSSVMHMHAIGSATGSSQGLRHWTENGEPVSASAARKYRKILTLLSNDDLETAQSMLSEPSTTMAARSTEIQVALAAAQARAASTPTSDGPQDDTDEGDEEDYDEGAYRAHENEQGLSLNGQAGVAAAHGAERALSHAEIWDDSSLVDAWDAAMQEYEVFDKARTQAKAALNGNRKTSALWHHAPAVGSPAAAQAKVEAGMRRQEEDAAAKQSAEEAKELQARKAQARRLLEQVSQEGNMPTGEAFSVAEPSEPPAKKQRKARGVVPPSAGIPGNAAWHLACATVSQTPNSIGSDDHVAEASNGVHSAAGAQIEADMGQSALSHDYVDMAAGTSQNDVLQNLAMSWYYAGYYLAQANGMMGTGNGDP